MKFFKKILILNYFNRKTDKIIIRDKKLSYFNEELIIYKKQKKYNYLKILLNKIIQKENIVTELNNNLFIKDFIHYEKGEKVNIYDILYLMLLRLNNKDLLSYYIKEYNKDDFYKNSYIYRYNQNLKYKGKKYE